jgi:putative addiction module CopG family antidote
MRYLDPMPTHTIENDEPLDRFVQDRVRSGSYQDANSVVHAGLGLLKARTDREQRKLARLNAAIQVGIDQIERGEGEIVPWDRLEHWLEGRGRDRA